MAPEADAAALEGWTFRRVPNALARGLAAASVVSVGLFGLHIGGWGLTDRLGWDLMGAAFLAGLPVAFLFTFLIAAPLLRAIARERLSRVRTVRLGALGYGGIVFLWMALVRPGPPPVLEPLTLEAGWTGDAVLLAYRQVFTPAAFALYGGLAAAAGWWAAFGARAEVRA
ncbi:MAG: hypothetical protein AAFR79_11825 [Pseudomonadota bacterium]